MKKCVLIPDSFKGTMSSIEICDIVGGKIKEFYPDCEIVRVPVADGGEGTVDCFLAAMDGEKVVLEATGPYFEKMEGFYAVVGNGRAIIEMAAVAGLPLVENRKNPGLTTTFGVGELVKDAVGRGCREIILGLGGSCTNDGGAGMAAALGVVFTDAQGEAFVPTGATLSKIHKIDVSGAKALLDGVKITVMCDINNPMHGPQGAAYIFGPQKGADEEMVLELDNQLKSLDQAIRRELGMDVSQNKGAGAAGAMGAGVMAFLGGELRQGIDTVLDVVGFDHLIQGADLIFTGEGKIDSQSLSGKVVIGVSSRAVKQKVPVIAVVGDIGDNLEEAYALGVSAIFSINRVAVPYEKAKLRAKSDLALTIADILRFRKITER